MMGGHVAAAIRAGTDPELDGHVVASMNAVVLATAIGFQEHRCSPAPLQAVAKDGIVGVHGSADTGISSPRMARRSGALSLPNR
jgi:hypothetical protein